MHPAAVKFEAELQTHKVDMWRASSAEEIDEIGREHNRRVARRLHLAVRARQSLRKGFYFAIPFPKFPAL